MREEVTTQGVIKGLHKEIERLRTVNADLVAAAEELSARLVSTNFERATRRLNAAIIKAKK